MMGKGSLKPKSMGRSLKHLPLKPVIIQGKNKVTIGDRHFNPNKDISAQQKTTKTSQQEQNIDNIKTIDSTKTTPIVTKSYHVNGVYTADIGGRKYYYKPQSEEKMEVMHPDGKIRLVRRGIKNDRLFEREQLSYDISKDLGLDFIPPTRMIKDQNGKDGSIQESVHSYEQRKTPDTPVEILDHKRMNWSHLIDSAENGNGFDVAVFDFITGNTDRNLANVMHRRDTHNLIGIDNGLSFPVHDRESISADYHKTAELNWAVVMSTNKAKLSKNFLSKLKSDSTFNKIADRLLKSGIEDEAKFGALYRLSALSEYIQKNNLNNFDSIDFMDFISPFIDSMKISDKRDSFFVGNFKNMVQNGVASMKDRAHRKARFGV